MAVRSWLTWVKVGGLSSGNEFESRSPLNGAVTEKSAGVGEYKDMYIRDYMERK